MTHTLAHTGVGQRRGVPAHRGRGGHVSAAVTVASSTYYFKAHFVTSIVASDSVPTASPKAHAAIAARLEGYPGAF
eukprot:1134494-Pelagomonas_calceolata.AAC.10